MEYKVKVENLDSCEHRAEENYKLHTRTQSTKVYCAHIQGFIGLSVKSPPSDCNLFIFVESFMIHKIQGESKCFFYS